MREQKISHLGMIGWAMFLTGALSLGSCSSDDTIDAIQGETITFGNVFVEKSTRATDPSYGEGKAIDKFQVWGKVTGNTGNTVNLYGGDGATVTKGTAAYGAAWACNETEYWIPSATYQFMAIANATSVTLTDGLPSVISYTADAADTYTTNGSKDLLLSELDTTDGTIDKNGIKTVTSSPAAVPSENPVAFTMSHLLSKAMFTFTNTDANAELTVSDIKMAGLNKEGTYDIATATWTSKTPYGETPLAFGGNVTVGTGEDTKTATSEHERLIIPGTYTITITFTVTDNKGGQPQNLTAEITQEFLPGHSYNFTADIKSGLTYIIFTIIPSDWGTESDRPIEG